MARRTADIADLPFGAVVGGIGVNAKTRLMVIRPSRTNKDSAECVVLTSAMPAYWDPGTIQTFTGDGWIVYSEETT